MKVWPCLAPKDKHLIRELRRKMARDHPSLKEVEMMREQIDDIIAADCIYCGEHMIE